MSTNYKKLGDYITQRREKNTAINLPICGVCREGLIPPKQQDADISLYNVFYKNDFIFNPARMELNSITLNTEYDKAICSSLYEIFYINDTSKLLPEFLFVQLKTDNFVRFCEFQGQGSVREYCRFANISEYPVIVPDLKEQEKIVNTYNAITKRIQLKQKINENLEKTAQTIYKKMFVEDDDENWKSMKLGELAELSAGGDKPECFSITETEKCNIPIFSNGIENYGLYGFTDKPKITKESVTVSARGTIGFPCLRLKPYFPIIRLVSVTPNETYTDAIYLYYYLKNTNIVSSGTTQQQLTVPEFKETKIVVPNRNTVDEFSVKVRKLFYYQKENEKEIAKLQELKQVVISRISGM